MDDKHITVPSCHKNVVITNDMIRQDKSRKRHCVVVDCRKELASDFERYHGMCNACRARCMGIPR